MGRTTIAPVRQHPRRSIRLHERFLKESPQRVDYENGIIKGVKVLGLSSPSHNRRYTPECLKRSAQLYEGAAVRVDHPDEEDEGYSADDVFGKLRNVQVRPDGIYADLHYLKKHRMAARVCEAAERMPDLFGLSHNADGDGYRDQDGTLVLEQITEVRSVDLVANPATTKGLFESVKTTKRKGRRPMKLKTFLEAAKLSKPARQTVTRLLEKGLMDADADMSDSDMPDELPVDAPPEDVGAVDPDAALKSGFRTSIVAVVDDDGIDAASKIKRIKELLQAHERLTTAAVTDEVPVEEDEDEDDMDDDMEEEEDHAASGKDDKNLKEDDDEDDGDLEEEEGDEDEDDDDMDDDLEEEEACDKDKPAVKESRKGKKTATPSTSTKDYKKASRAELVALLESRDAEAKRAREREQKRKEARTLLESKGVKDPSQVIVNAVASTEDRRERLVLVREVARGQRALERTRTDNLPRTKSLREGKNGKGGKVKDVTQVDSTDDFVGTLTSSD